MQPSNAVIREGLARPEAALDQDDLGIEPIIINRLQYFGVGMPAEHRLALSSSPLQKATRSARRRFPPILPRDGRGSR